jgi:hypothetical protein
LSERPDETVVDDPAAAEIVRAVEAGSDAIVVPEEMLQEEAPGAPPKPAAEAQSLYARILTMGMAEKIKLALRGNKDARGILIRDAAKMIRRLVLMNPRISDAEVISVARNRSADEDLIRLIVNRREWMRNYQVRLALAQNPRTPLVIAIRQLPTLGERDLRALAKSKNVGASVAAQARRMIANMSGPK